MAPSPYRKLKINGRTINEHRWLMEQHLGRQLRQDELVHHRNGDKKDNRIENLEVIDAKTHSMHHNQRHALSKSCVVCGETFTPHPTKRKRAQTCSWACRNELIRRRALERKSA